MHMALIKDFDAMTPKHQQMVHPLIESLRLGNPRFYATWLDESLNKDLKASCRFASQTTFDVVVLPRMIEVLREIRGKKRLFQDGD